KGLGVYRDPVAPARATQSGPVGAVPAGDLVREDGTGADEEAPHVDVRSGGNHTQAGAAQAAGRSPGNAIPHCKARCVDPACSREIACRADQVPENRQAVASIVKAAAECGPVRAIPPGNTVYSNGASHRERTASI